MVCSARVQDDLIPQRIMYAFEIECLYAAKVLRMNPYIDLPEAAFWKTGVAKSDPYALEGIYKKKFRIRSNAKIATAGSCFAQHISPIT